MNERSLARTMARAGCGRWQAALTALMVTCLLGNPVATGEQDRSSTTEKGSLVVYPNVEVRWNNAPPYGVIQDTFVHLSNDFPGAVDVKLFFFNGDPPQIAEPARWEGDPPIEGDALVARPIEQITHPGTMTYRRDRNGDLMPVSGMEHGIAISIGLQERCIGQMIEGTMTVSYNDSFGDSTEIRDAFFTVNDPLGARIPVAGMHLEIIEVFGNTTAEVSGALPILIGQENSFLSGLPGLNDPGEVTFRVTGYVIQEDDPVNFRVHGHALWRDMCDEPDTAGCDEEELETIIAATPLRLPLITLDRSSVESPCDDAGEKDVTFYYTVRNPGVVALEDVVLVDESTCGVIPLADGDINNDMRLNRGEIWTYHCVTTSGPGGITSYAVVSGMAGTCVAQAEATIVIAPCGPERDHPGWNFIDNIITLTANEPSYWSASSGLPKGVSRWSSLDPNPTGEGPGRPDPDDDSQRFLRGYVVAFAIQQAPVGDEIRWNHLIGGATIVNYREEHAWEYGATSFQVVDAFDHGAPTTTPGALFLDGSEYASHGQMLLMNFIASDSDAYRGAGFPVTHDTALTLMPLFGDFRSETEGPRTTNTVFDIWNENEIKFTNLERCLTCWDSTLLSRYPTPNHFMLSALQTNAGKARIDGVTGSLCVPGPARSVALVGVAAKLITPGIVMGNGLINIGSESGHFRYDVHDPPPPSRWEPEDVVTGAGTLGIDP